MILKVPGRGSQSSSDWKCSRNGWRRINHRPLTGGCVTVSVKLNYKVGPITFDTVMIIAELY